MADARISAKYETLLCQLDSDGIALCTFNRPEKRNALDIQMVEELHALVRGLAAEQAVRAVVFTGAGQRAFVSGADIGQLRDRGRLDALARINSALFFEIERLPVPTIAAIRGYALGGGCELALACDLRVCSEDARLGQPEVKLGIIPGAGATYRLPRLIGLGLARELIFTGRMVDADEALRIGLVNRVVPADSLIDASRQLAGEIAANSALAVRLAKSAINSAAGHADGAAMALESAAQAVLFEDPDKHRRMTEFLERRRRR